MPENNDKKFQLYKIKPAVDRAKGLKDEIVRHLDNSIEDMGTDFGGYAVVLWSMGGRCVTSYNSNAGLVCRGLVPTLVHDALQRHVVLDMVQEDETPKLIPPA
jgi:hypothetical protein